ncbi:hypothetical protein [Micromonospora sp. LOL_021]|uniref:hypothetical protein n=1 Tax=Micromonospora sp. LOL_021 TaxID=3345417 RepID=UPI003A84CC0C
MALSAGRFPAAVPVAGMSGRSSGYEATVRIGNTEIRPLGGGLGCLVMVLLSLILSVAATIALNVAVR